MAIKRAIHMQISVVTVSHLKGMVQTRSQTLKVTDSQLLSLKYGKSHTSSETVTQSEGSLHIMF
jgi:hypothetical protein